MTEIVIRLFNPRVTLILISVKPMKQLTLQHHSGRPALFFFPQKADLVHKEHSSKSMQPT